MKIITDTHARPWTVNINVATIKRVRSLLNIDMLEPESFLILTQDVISLCDILYVVCKEERTIFIVLPSTSDCLDFTNYHVSNNPSRCCIC